MKHYQKSAFKVFIRDTALYRQSDLYIKCFNHHIAFLPRERLWRKRNDHCWLVFVWADVFENHPNFVIILTTATSQPAHILSSTSTSNI